MMKELEGPEGPVRVLVEEPDRETPRPVSKDVLGQTQTAPEDLIPARPSLSRTRAQPQEPSRKGEGASCELRDPEEDSEESPILDPKIQILSDGPNSCLLDDRRLFVGVVRGPRRAVKPESDSQLVESESLQIRVAEQLVEPFGAAVLQEEVARRVDVAYALQIEGPVAVALQDLPPR